MPEFNARAARAKRPCPLWVDAFLRDTTHLEADEIGAYMLLLMAMWIRESCDLPDDDARLARIARVSLRLWKSRIGQVIRPFFKTENGALISKRLREEAAFVEKSCQAQSDRKTAPDNKSGTYAKPQGRSDPNGADDEKSDNALENNDQASSADITTDEPRHHPTYNLQPTEEEKKKEPPPPPDPEEAARKLAVRAVDPGVLSEFEAIWTHYPRRVGVGSARKAWIKARKQATFEEVSKPLGQFIRAIRGTPTDKIPHLATWLNQERWHDEQSHAANRPRTSDEDLDRLSRITSDQELDRLFSAPQLRVIC